jgi:hypothetical protein
MCAPRRAIRIDSGSANLIRRPSARAAARRPARSVRGGRVRSARFRARRTASYGTRLDSAACRRSSTGSRRVGGVDPGSVPRDVRSATRDSHRQRIRELDSATFCAGRRATTGAQCRRWPSSFGALSCRGHRELRNQARFRRLHTNFERQPSSRRSGSRLRTARCALRTRDSHRQRIRKLDSATFCAGRCATTGARCPRRPAWYGAVSCRAHRGSAHTALAAYRRRYGFTSIFRAVFSELM